MSQQFLLFSDVSFRCLLPFRFMLSLTIRVYLLYRRPLINLYNDYFTNLLP